MKMIWRDQYQSKVSGYGWNDFFFFWNISVKMWRDSRVWGWISVDRKNDLYKNFMECKEVQNKNKGCSAFAKKPMLHSTKYLHDLQIFTVCLYRVISYWVSLRWLRDGTFQGKEIRIESKKFMDFEISIKACTSRF